MHGQFWGSFLKGSYASKLDEHQGKTVPCQRNGLDLTQQTTRGAESMPLRAGYQSGTEPVLWGLVHLLLVSTKNQDEKKGKQLASQHTTEDVWGHTQDKHRPTLEFNERGLVFTLPWELQEGWALPSVPSENANKFMSYIHVLGRGKRHNQVLWSL